jgi:hypothetical protein
MSSDKRILLVTAGAQTFRQDSGLDAHPAFFTSVQAFRKYMEPYAADVLDLFDDERQGLSQVEKIETWLRQKNPDTWDALFFYYVGHGMVNSHQEFYMAIRDTRRPYDYYSSIQSSALAIALRDWIATKAVVMVMDCCFAGAIRNAMGSADTELQRNLKTFTALANAQAKTTPKGVVQLCAAGKDYVASALDSTAKYTMFTGALLHVLEHGVREAGPQINLLELAEAAKNYVREQYPNEAVDPVVNFSEAIGGKSFAFEAIFPNNAFHGSRTQLRSSTTPPREASRAAGPRRKKLSLTSVWRDWFGKDEVCLGVALSPWFRPAEETLSGLHAKLVTERDNQRHWLICSRERIYMAVDRPNLVEPEITWSYPIDCDDKRRPRIKIALAGSNDTDFIVSVAGQQVHMTRSLFPKGEPTSGLYRRISKIAREDGPTRGDTQTTAFECDTLKGIRDFLDYSEHSVSANALEKLKGDVSDSAALGAMHLVRMRRRHPWLKREETERLRPILEALCERKKDSRRHRYFAQLAYLLWCDNRQDEQRRIDCLTRAIELRNQSFDRTKYRRYEATRAVSRILADERFLAKKPSKKEGVAAILQDLKEAREFIEDDLLSEQDKVDVTKWLKLNGLRL